MIGAPGRMTQVRASNVSDNSVNLTWDEVDGMGPQDKYEIYFSQTGGLGDYIYWTAVSTTSFEVQNLYPDSTYYFRIRGKNTCGVCAFSEPL
jgi:fibronectin type 3 domain-containing protein